MTFIRLLHDRRLRLPSPKLLPPLPPAGSDASEGGLTLLSFRASERMRADEERTIDATSRFVVDAGSDVRCFALEWDSPLAPLLLWDLAHGLQVGSRIFLAEPGAQVSFLDRAYFRPFFSVADGIGERMFEKLAPLPAEADRGLDRWTFGIPVGPEDATLLNAVVERILALDVPEKEVLLCGRPGANFAYWDAVRIVGEDLPPAPPINLSAKKNRLAREARHGNLCFLHDRVMLPRDFYAAVRRFGDDYPFVGFQSLFFDDHWGLLPRRYSDLNMLLKPVDRGMVGMRRSGALNATAFSPSVFAEVEHTGFVCSHPLRYSVDRGYINGSFCMAKRAVWRFCMQDEGLHWTEFEDVEQGLRGSALGIPSRCNPFAFTQSLISRAGFSFGGSVSVEHADGRIGTIRLPLEALPVPRKPLLRISEQEAQIRLEKFIQTYVPAGWAGRPQTDLRGAAGVRARLEAVVAAVYGAVMPKSVAACRGFVADFEKLLLLDQVAYGRRSYLVEQLSVHAERAKVNLIEQSFELVNMVAQRPRGPFFYEALSDYLPRAGWHWRFTLPLAAALLWISRNRYAHHPDGLAGFLHAIRQSFPRMGPQAAARERP